MLIVSNKILSSGKLNKNVTDKHNLGTGFHLLSCWTRCIIYTVYKAEVIYFDRYYIFIYFMTYFSVDFSYKILSSGKLNKNVTDKNNLGTGFHLLSCCTRCII